MKPESVSSIRLSNPPVRLFQVAAGFGLVVFLLGILFVPERIWANFLVAEFYLISLGMGAAFLIAVQYASNAGWGVGMRRIPEAIASTLPAAGLGAVVLCFGIHTLYEWSHASVVMNDPILQSKSGWLNEPFFVMRLVGYFAIWIGLTQMILRNSVKQDGHPSLELTRKNVRNSAIFLIVGTFTFCMATIDLLMSLQPHWYSTVFAWLTLSGMFLSGLASIAVVLVILRRLGYSRFFTTEHLHVVGSLMMAFSFFWVYMWVSQHMLIWYSNIPEETSYYVFRHFGGWGSLSFLNVLLNWMIPFLVLLPRATKRSDKVMLQVALVILAGHWLDLYIMVMPVTFGPEPLFSIWEVGPIVGVLGLFFWLVLRKLQKQNLVPLNDPYLVESLPHLVGESHATAD